MLWLLFYWQPVLLLLLLKDSSSKSNNFVEPPNSCSKELSGALHSVMDDRPPPGDLLLAISDFMDWGFSLDDIKGAWQRLPHTAQSELLTALFACQPDWQGVAS